MDLEASNSTSTNNQHGPNPHLHSHFFTDEYDPESTCSTPYVSAPSSPGRSGPGPGPINGGFFYSCPASPMHFAISSTAVASSSAVSSPDNNNFGYEFEFSARFGSSGSGQPGSMSSADELFLDGKIRPMKLSTHLERPQVLAPLMDLDEEDADEEEGDVAVVKRGRDLRGFRDKSLRRRTRSMSPLRTTSFEFGVADDDEEDNNVSARTVKNAIKIDSCDGTDDNEAKNDESSTPSVSASSSRSSSAGRNSKRWVFLKDFLYRSKSEGRSNNKFWSNISFSPAKDKKPINSSSNGGSNSNSQVNVTNAGMDQTQKEKVKGKKPVNGVGKRRVPTSPHELHYKASRAQAEEMRKKTFLPYRQGLLGCLGFSSKSYGAMNGFARALNPVSSR